MKYIISVVFCFFVLTSKAGFVLSGQVKGVHKSQYVSVSVAFDCWYYKQHDQIIHTDGHGRFSIAFPIAGAKNIFFTFGSKRALLYAEGNKSLQIQFDSADVQGTLVFKGGLKSENDLRHKLGLTFFSLHPKTWSDSTSSAREIIEQIQSNQILAMKLLQAQRAKVSDLFYAATKADIDYFLPATIWNIIKGKRNPLRQDRQIWQWALAEAHKNYPLSNPAALNSYYYQTVMTYYPKFSAITAADKPSFEKYVASVLSVPLSRAMSEVKERGERYWEYKELTRSFTGLPLELAIASFIDNGINLGNLTYLGEAYSDFLVRFPKSRYRLHVDSVMGIYMDALSQGGRPVASFEKADTSTNSLEKILAAHKGRVVYLDVWGSWCTPCRQQFAYTEPLKVYFAGKEVDFVYIAFEHDRGKPEELWRKTIQFYKLKGRHILADETLKKNLEALYAPNNMNFPSYILVDKEGRLRTLTTASPSDGQVLYNQIEQLLKK